MDCIIGYREQGKDLIFIMYATSSIWKVFLSFSALLPSFLAYTFSCWSLSGTETVMVACSGRVI